MQIYGFDNGDNILRQLYDIRSTHERLRAHGKLVVDDYIRHEMKRLAESNKCCEAIDGTKFRDLHIAPLSSEVKESIRINEIKNDEEKIIEYNKKHYDFNYYGILDKKACELKIYNKSGKVVKKFVVGIGKSIGDGLQAYYYDHFYHTKDEARAELHRFTTAGEFGIDETLKASDAYTSNDGKIKIMDLRGDSHGIESADIAIHMCYKPEYNARKNAILSEELEDNRMSYGCINVIEEEYDEMHKYLVEGCKLYVLPEEEGNKLILEKQKDGTYKFEQLYHRDETRSISKERASRVWFDVRPENHPKSIESRRYEENVQEMFKEKPLTNKEIHLKYFPAFEQFWKFEK